MSEGVRLSRGQDSAAGWSLHHDPLYGEIEIPPVIGEAMELPTMQRLRWINQLSHLDLVFPGGAYSRFEHSVGVYLLARRAIETLRRKYWAHGRDADPSWPELDSPNMALAVELAALFHDIGHGPFSHTFEIYSRRVTKGRAQLGQETLAPRLIAEGVGKWDDIPRFLNRLHTRTLRDGASSNDAEWLRPENIARIASGRPPLAASRCVFLAELVSGIFDVDRLDYLPRDSLHTGVPTAIDVGTILHAYTIVPWTSAGDTEGRNSGAPKDQPVWRLVLDAEAADAVEALLANRDLAFRRVYYHSKHRIAQEMMVSAMEEIGPAHPPEEFALLIDNELLDLLRKGPPFSRDVAARIQDHRLYEAIPYEINVATDLDEGARQTWRELNVGLVPRDGFAPRLASLEKQLGCGDSERILFHLERSPLAKATDYTTPYFRVPQTGEVVSLVALRPHLWLPHTPRTEWAGPQLAIEPHTFHVESLSKILISYPLEVLERRFADVRSQYSGMGDGILTCRDAMADGLFDRVFLPVVTCLLDCIGYRDGDRRDALIERIRAYSRWFLRDLVERLLLE